MKIDSDLLSRMKQDLGLNTPFEKGKSIPVHNCWHFSSDGNSVDAIFVDGEDFKAGMNRIYVVSRKFKVIILAFTLMDTHVHFILWGEFEECNRFVHEYMRITSMFIAHRHSDNNKLDSVPIHYQEVSNDRYLKNVICYVIKNAPVGGLPFNCMDYPWSSSPLYFRKAGLWSSPQWASDTHEARLGTVETRTCLHTKEKIAETRMIGDLIFPGEYVAYEIVESIFKTCKSLCFFMCSTKDDLIEAKGGNLSLLSIPMQEMRQHKNEVCKELFGTDSSYKLNTQQRIMLARKLRSRYNSSVKQILRLCGIVYEEGHKLI